MSTHPEPILVVPRSEFEARGIFHGYHPTDARQNVGAYLTSHQDERKITEYISRDLVENDENYLQIIPYIMITCGLDIFAYTRGKKGGETRLHDQLSVGVGGHIEGDDGVDPFNAYIQGALREIREETGLDLEAGHLEGTVLGMLHDENTPVGRVHLGILHAINISPSQAARVIELAEDTKVDPFFTNLMDLSKDLVYFNNLEPWSQWAVTRIVEIMKTTKPWEDEGVKERFRYLALAGAELARASCELLMQEEPKHWMIALENVEAAIGGVSCMLSALAVNKDIDLKQVTIKEREFYATAKENAKHQDWIKQDASMARRGN